MNSSLEKIQKIKSELRDQIIFLGHHYQSDEIMSFADIAGDSLELSRRAANEKKSYIIFCGVNFMAETADILTSPSQKVILPDWEAGCSMADMAELSEVQEAWNYLGSMTSKKIVPITYINCRADLKAFVGNHGGTICTSSNAKKIISWALNQGEKLLFFPDQHLGRNTCFELGISLDEMVLYDLRYPNGGLSKEQIEKAKVILWCGYCCVHQHFTVEQIEKVKRESPKTRIIVHPECAFDVVRAAHENGSTSYIADVVAKAPAGSSFAIGTESNLVERLKKNFPNKDIRSLAPHPALCKTMGRITPEAVLDVLNALQAGNPKNIVTVPQEIKTPALKALELMLKIS